MPPHFSTANLNSQPDPTVGFRKTRTGAAFSPWVRNVGEPLHADPNFHVHRRIREALLAAAEGSATATCDPDTDDRPVTTPDTPMSATTNTTPPASPPIAAPPPSRTSLAHCDSHDLDVPALHTPELIVDPAVDPVGFDGSVSKTKQHARAHRYRRRRKNRARAQDPEMNRPMKLVALSHTTNPIKQPTVSNPSGISNDAEATAPHGLTDSPTSPPPRRIVLRAGDGEYAKSGGPIVSGLPVEMDGVRVATSGYVGVKYKPTQEELSAKTVDDFMAMGFTYYEWDGISSHAILDATGTYVIGSLDGSPDDPTYRDDINVELQAEFDRANQAYHFDSKDSENRRGAGIRAISCGISFGGGQQRVGNLRQGSRANQAIVDRLVALPAMKRVANYGNALLQMYQPKIYKLYDSVLTRLCERDPTLRRLFHNNVRAGATFNVGPRTVTDLHYDHLNLAYGPCTITAFGTYNPKTGGHIVLWDLRMVIEFPPLASITIMSAIVGHSNIDIAEGERRYSFTQYSAAGLFRWEDCGGMSKKAFEALGQHMAETGREYWERAVNSRLSTWKEVQEMWRRA